MKALWLLLLAFAPLAAAGEWRSSAPDSSLDFIPSYEGTPLPARFEDFSVRMIFDPAAPGDGCLEVTVHMASADMDDADLNEGIAGPEFFHFERYPLAQFASRAISAGPGKGEFVAAGELRLKGRTRSIEVPFTWHRSAAGAEMTGSLTLSRHDFAIGTGEWEEDDTIDERVEVRFHVVLHEVP